jgi:hypothetical protein
MKTLVFILVCDDVINHRPPKNNRQNITLLFHADSKEWQNALCDLTSINLRKSQRLKK